MGSGIWAKPITSGSPIRARRPAVEGLLTVSICAFLRLLHVVRVPPVLLLPNAKRIRVNEERAVSNQHVRPSGTLASPVLPDPICGVCLRVAPVRCV